MSETQQVRVSNLGPQEGTGSRLTLVVPFILSLRTTALLHRKPSTAGTFRESYRVQRQHKMDIT